MKNSTMIRDGQGRMRELGNPQKARKWAARELGIPAAQAAFITTRREAGGFDAWWTKPEDLDYFRGVLEAEGKTILHVSGQ